MMAALLLCGCALGFRGEAAFTGTHSLDGTLELRIELPDTPLTVEACAADDPETCPAELHYEGKWLSVAGSRQDARDHAATPTLVLERDEGFATLRAELPLEVEGTVDLAMGTLRLPDDRDLDLRTGLGDVEVRGSEASVVIAVDMGDVRVRGADGGLAVHTGLGDLDVVTAGHAELHTDDGHVRVEQSGAPRDLRAHTGRGEITVTLASDADLDLEIHTAGRITVRTPSITTLTSGRLVRRQGNGSIRIELRSPRGDIEVRSVDPLAPR
jgi:Putative adhesin